MESLLFATLIESPSVLLLKFIVHVSWLHIFFNRRTTIISAWGLNLWKVAFSFASLSCHQVLQIPESQLFSNIFSPDVSGNKSCPPFIGIVAYLCRPTSSPCMRNKARPGFREAGSWIERRILRLCAQEEGVSVTLWLSCWHRNTRPSPPALHAGS